MLGTIGFLAITIGIVSIIVMIIWIPKIKKNYHDLSAPITMTPAPVFQAPTPMPYSCDLSSDQCKTINEIKAAMEANNYEQLAGYFEEQTLRCTGSDQYNICQGKPANSVMTGYYLGISKAGEGGLETKENLIQSLKNENYASEPYSFQKFSFNSNTATPSGELEYLNPSKTGMFDFMLIDSNGKIKIKSLTVGPSYEYMKSFQK